MRDYKLETEKRVQFIKDTLKKANANGIVFGNSGGKDCALVGILCKMACENTVGIIMPCSSKRNFTLDFQDGKEVADKFNIKTEVIDITPVKQAMKEQVEKVEKLEGLADANINPRLRMTALYAVGAARNMLVAGTGNRSERYVGYFTKWGDGAFDLNPIADLTVREVYEFLRYLDCPKCILEKAPSAALFEGQTDEQEMGFKYEELDAYLLDGIVPEKAIDKIERMHRVSEHKRAHFNVYEEEK